MPSWRSAGKVELAAEPVIGSTHDPRAGIAVGLASITAAVRVGRAFYLKILHTLEELEQLIG